VLEGKSHNLSTWGKHGLHPVAKRPKTSTEKLKDHLADGGEEYSSGARGGTPAIIGMEKAIDPDTGIHHPDAVVPPQGSASSTFHPRASSFVSSVHNAFGSTTRQQDVDAAKGTLEAGFEAEERGHDPIQYEGAQEIEAELAERGVTGLGAEELVAAWGKNINMVHHILSQPEMGGWDWMGSKEGHSFIWDTIAESYGGNSITEPYGFALEGPDKYLVDFDDDYDGSYGRQLNAEIDAVHQELKGHSGLIGRSISSPSDLSDPALEAAPMAIEPPSPEQGRWIDPTFNTLPWDKPEDPPALKPPPEPEDPSIQNMRKAEETRKRLEDMTGAEKVKAYKEGKIRINRSYRQGQPQHPQFAEEQAEIDAEEKLDKALFWPTHPKENGKGRKVKTRVGDTAGGYPT